MSEVSITLNDSQKAILDHKTGPLLVVAGAGTGKTFVIVERIKKLIDNNVRPESILAITFTEKAASEMLNRLLEQRSGFQIDLPIMTFNGFGESILREFGSHLGLGRSFRLMSEEAQLVFVRERLDKLNLDYFLPLAGLPDSVLKDILGVFSQAKQNIISPDDYVKFATELPEHDEADREEKKQQLELARLYKTYIDLCREANVIDYDDQIFLVIELLRSKPNVRKNLQERYQAIFVDEFQDTNPMQSALIDLLVGQEQNLVVVGDDDQSIYGFRGATLANILNFKDRYPAASEVALVENFRSGQGILDAAYRLIRNNDPYRLEHSLNINKRLIAKNKDSNPPEIKHFKTLNEELYWVSQDVASRIKNGQQPGSIAVLARSKRTAKKAQEALEQAAIPAKLLGQSVSLYAQPAVRMLIELCRTITEPLNNASLHHTLVSDLFNIANDVVAPAANSARYEHEPLDTVLLRQAGENEHIVAALSSIKEARSQAGILPVGILLYRFLDKTGYKNRLYKNASTDGVAAATLQAISQFFVSLREFESIAIQPTIIQYVESLPALIAGGEQIEQDDTSLLNPEEVSILTIHKSKGLEWDTVYIPDCTEQSFPIRQSSRGLSLPEQLQTATKTPADEHYAEERRLAYVAVTRAKNDLILTYADLHKNDGAKRKPSRFLIEMFGDDQIEATAVEGGENAAAAVPSFQTSIQMVHIPKSLYDGRRVYLTVSEAAALLNCPLDFYYKFVLQAPEDPTPNTAYGTVLHTLFEEINRGILDNNLESIEKLEKKLEQNWSKAGFATKTQQQQAYLRAQQTLRRFYQKAISSNKPQAVEEPFRVVLSDEQIELRGRFDVILADENGVDIRDYKTGSSVSSAEKAQKRASNSVQLSMYALAWQQLHGELPQRLSLEFVDMDFVGSTRKTEKGIATLRTKLAKGAEHIRSGVFPLGSKHDYCIHP